MDLGPHTQEQRAGGRRAERLRLQHGRLGKVAQHTCRGNDCRWSLRELADSPGLRIFYGFLAGEASQYEPNLVRNTPVVLPPKSPEEGYHLSEDLADDAISWLHTTGPYSPISRSLCTGQAARFTGRTTL